MKIHIIAPAEIKTVFDLEGKRIEAPKDVGLYSAKAIFSRLHINVTYDSTYLNEDTGALQQVIDGKADAWIVGTAKVMPIARNLKNENRRLHLVSIPYDKRLQDLYLPSEFSSDDYPNLIPPGETVDTVAAGILLASFNWPEKSDRYQKWRNSSTRCFPKLANSRSRHGIRNGRRRALRPLCPDGKGSKLHRTGSTRTRSKLARPIRLRCQSLGNSWRSTDIRICRRRSS